MTESLSTIGLEKTDIENMCDVGISLKFLSMLLRYANVEAPSFLPELREQGSLSASELEVLETGGARLNRRSQYQTRIRAIAMLHELQRQCRVLIEEALATRDVSKLLCISETKVRELAVGQPRELVAFRLRNASLIFPKWQFSESGTRPHLAELLSSVETAVHPLALTTFMTTKTNDLEHDGQALTPCDWLAQGFPLDPLLRLARDL